MNNDIPGLVARVEGYVETGQIPQRFAKDLIAALTELSKPVLPEDVTDAIEFLDSLAKSKNPPIGDALIITADMLERLVRENERLQISRQTYSEKAVSRLHKNEELQARIDELESTLAKAVDNDTYQHSRADLLQSQLDACYEAMNYIRKNTGSVQTQCEIGEALTRIKALGDSQ